VHTIYLFEIFKGRDTLEQGGIGEKLKLDLREMGV
jgi:hypothetical protein